MAIHRFIIMVAFWGLIFQFQIAYSTDKRKLADSYYHQAIEYIQNNNIELAIRLLKDIVRIDDTYAKAYHQLALIYMNESTVQGRFNATIQLEKALRIEPENPDFRFDWALLNLKKGMTYQARKEFEKILKENPGNVAAYKHLAEMEEENMLHYKDMVSIDFESEGIIYFKSFSEEHQHRAAEYYKKAIASDPLLSDSYYKLALIYFESENYKEMIQLLESAVKIFPDSKDCHLFLGLAFHRAGNFVSSMNEYNIALELMGGKEKALLNLIENMLSPDELAYYNSLNTKNKEKYNEKFWTSKDPFYLSDVNERKIEHFSRVAYANLRYFRPEKDMDGWRTDQGKILIRYGFPDFKYRTRASIGNFTDNSRNPLNHSKEVWIYPGFEYVFEDRYLSQNYDFAYAGFGENYIDYKLIYEDMIKVQPDYYKLVPDSQYFETPYEIVEFSGDNNKTECEVCYLIPVSDSEKIQQGIFFFDDNYNLVLQKKDELSFDANKTIIVNNKKYFSHYKSIEMAPGCYNFGLEFNNLELNKKAIRHEKVTIDTLSKNTLFISDVLFANEIIEPPPTKNQHRNDYKFYPNPLKIYAPNQPIALYFEIYNLSLEPSGKSSYEINYEIEPDLESLSNLKKLLKKIGLFEKRGIVKSSFIYEGDTKKEIYHQNILLNEATNGVFKLTLNVVDLVSGKTVSKTERFSIYE